MSFSHAQPKRYPLSFCPLVFTNLAGFLVADRPDFGYMVKRSAFGNVPVYTDYRNGGTKKVTIIRRVDGDIAVREMTAML